MVARAVDILYFETVSPTEPLVQIQNNFTQMFLIMLSILNVQWVSLHQAKWLPMLKIDFLKTSELPMSLDLQANTLPRPCKSRLLQQGSRSVFIIHKPCDMSLVCKNPQQLLVEFQQKDVHIRYPQHDIVG